MLRGTHRGTDAIEVAESFRAVDHRNPTLAALHPDHADEAGVGIGQEFVSREPHERGEISKANPAGAMLEFFSRGSAAWLSAHGSPCAVRSCASVERAERREAMAFRR